MQSARDVRKGHFPIELNHQPINTTPQKKSFLQDLVGSVAASTLFTAIYTGIGYPKYGVGGSFYKILWCKIDPNEASMCPAPTFAEASKEYVKIVLVLTIGALFLSRVLNSK